VADHKELLQNVVIESEDTFDGCREKINTVIGIKERANTDFSNTIMKKALQALETTGHAFFNAQQRVVKECKETLNLQNEQEEKLESTSSVTLSGRSSSRSEK
jgi:hypothetical protein